MNRPEAPYQLVAGSQSDLDSLARLPFVYRFLNLRRRISTEHLAHEEKGQDRFESTRLRILASGHEPLATSRSPSDVRVSPVRSARSARGCVESQQRPLLLIRLFDTSLPRSVNYLKPV